MAAKRHCADQGLSISRMNVQFGHLPFFFFFCVKREQNAAEETPCGYGRESDDYVQIGDRGEKWSPREVTEGREDILGER